MRLGFIATAAFALALAAGGARAEGGIRGEYLETRSANVFAGACHHEGEVTTVGRDAVMAWRFTDGSYEGVSLKGVRLVAVVNASKNFEFADAVRRSVVYLDADATDAQRRASAALVRDKFAAALGEVLAVKAAPIRFTSSDKTFEVTAGKAAYMKVNKSVGDICCLQEQQVWGTPFIGLEQARTGFGVQTRYQDSDLISSWAASEMNNAYFGAFAL